MNTDPITPKEGQFGMLPEDEVIDSPTTDANYIDLNELHVTPSSVYTELLPIDASTSMLSNENISSHVPLCEDMTHFIASLSTEVDINRLSSNDG